MNSTRKIAVVAGVFFIVSTGAALAAAHASVSDFIGPIRGYYSDTNASGSPAPPRPLAGR